MMTGVCLPGIDWSATGTWFSGFVTLAGVVVACLAMRTWREQIRIQDRYQKADSLLHSFILCIRAGSNWQWDCGVGERREPLKQSDKQQLWQTALMDYRLSWHLAHGLFGTDQGANLNSHPERLQSGIIGAGIHLSSAPEGTLLFFAELDKLMDAGMNEIRARKEAKKPWRFKMSSRCWI